MQQVQTSDLVFDPVTLIAYILSVSAEEFAAARRRLDEAGVAYVGPDRGIDNSLYIRDPNGLGIELYQEELGWFEGEPLLGR